MTPATPPAFRALAAAALLLALAAPAARGEGIDLVFLVDVSGSMYNDPKQPLNPNRPRGLNGNDIQRIRWDAVLLSLNLLAAEDNVLVIPFNQYAPALTEYPELRKDQQYPVPGRLPEKFFHPRSPEGQRVRTQIVSFSHDVNPPWNQLNEKNEWNGDTGGTAILLALEKAKEALAASPADRKRFVILLTDGHEDSTNKPEGFGSGNVNGWLDAYADQKSPGPRTRVYTIGLGDQVDVDLLETIANKTGGHYEPAASNGALIDVFRTLIWQLKGCWTKPKPIAPDAPGGSENDLMSGISDLGLLSYRIGPAQESRNYFALGQTEELAFVWKGAAGAPLKTVAETFRSATDEASYTYAYYDPKGLGPEVRLVSTWKPSASKRMLWFSKHTNRPLFKISEPSQGTFQRFEAMRIAVDMDELPPVFESSKFELSAILKPTDDKSPIKPLESPPFTYDPKVKQFHYEFDLTRIGSMGGNTDGYSLAVTARGKPTDQDHSLRDYKLQLPPIDVQVVNRLRLQSDTETIGTPDKKPVKTIKLRPAGSKLFQSPKGMAPIALKVTPERNTAAAQPSESAALKVNEFGNLEGELSFTFSDNAAEGLHEGGMLRVTSDKTEPLLVRYRVEVNAKRLGFNRSPINKIDFKQGEAVASEMLQVFLDGSPVPPKPPRTFAVSIPKGPSFGVEELWLVKNGQVGTRGQQSLSLGPNESFHVMFNPSNDHEPGLYRFRLMLAQVPDVRGQVYGADEGFVKLDYMAPTIGLDQPAGKYVQLGQSLIQELPVKLEGAQAKRKVFFRTFGDVKKGIAGPPEFEGRDPEAPAIELEAIDDPKEMTAASPPRPQALRVRVTAPPKIDCGTYTLSNGYLAADKTDLVAVPLTVHVNDLKLTDENGHDLNGPLIFYPIRGWALTRKVHVFAATGDLGVDEVSVEDGKSFLNPLNNVNRPNLHIERALPRAVKGSDGRGGVELSLTVEHPEPSFEPYSGSLVIHCEKQKLRKDLACVVQWVEVLKARETASGKKAARER